MVLPGKTHLFVVWVEYFCPFLIHLTRHATLVLHFTSLHAQLYINLNIFVLPDLQHLFLTTLSSDFAMPIPMMSYQDWLLQRQAAHQQAAHQQPTHQQAAPQAFDNRLHTYTYHARQSDPKPEELTPAMVPHAGNHWARPAYYLLPQPYAYPPFQYGYCAQAPTAAAPAMYYYPGQYQQYCPTYAVAPPPDNNNPNGYHHHWYGRTAAEVVEDNRRIAARERVHEPNDMRPLNPRDDQLFWVRELDGTFTLRTYATIEGDLQPGKWHQHPASGSAFFVRRQA